MELGHLILRQACLLVEAVDVLGHTTDRSSALRQLGDGVVGGIRLQCPDTQLSRQVDAPYLAAGICIGQVASNIEERRVDSRPEAVRASKVGYPRLHGYAGASEHQDATGSTKGVDRMSDGLIHEPKIARRRKLPGRAVVAVSMKRSWVFAGFLVLAAGTLLVLGGRDPAPVAPAPTAGGAPSSYDPVRAGEPLPDGYRALLPRDAIAPVYRPSFLAAQDAPWQDNALVIGVEIDGKAKAYPVSYLNRREMVIDRLAGIPILVTW